MGVSRPNHTKLLDEADMSETTAGSSETRSTPSRGRGWELVKTRDFGFLFAGQTISQIGDSLNKVALLWFVYDLTGSALKMAVVGLLQTLPPLLFGPLIGVYLDRVRKKPVMIGVDLLRTLMVFLIPVLYALEVLTLDWLYVLVFATAIFSTVFGPALTSAVPLIVPKDRLVAANALMQTTTNVGLLVDLPSAVSALRSSEPKTCSMLTQRPSLSPHCAYSPFECMKRSIMCVLRAKA